MATNTGENRRNGAQRKRSQSYNPVTDTWTKRDKETGQFMTGGKKKPYKGVTKE